MMSYERTRYDTVRCRTCAVAPNVSVDRMPPSNRGRRPFTRSCASKGVGRQGIGTLRTLRFSHVSTLCSTCRERGREREREREREADRYLVGMKMYTHVCIALVEDVSPPSPLNRTSSCRHNRVSRHRRRFSGILGLAHRALFTSTAA